MFHTQYKRASELEIQGTGGTIRSREQSGLDAHQFDQFLMSLRVSMLLIRANHTTI